MKSEAVLGLANYEVTGIEHSGGVVRITARYLGSTACPDCQAEKLRSKGRYLRKVRHETWGMRHCWLILEGSGCVWSVAGDSVSSFLEF